MDSIFCVKEERIVDNANCVKWNRKVFQIERQDFRYSFAKARVTVNKHINRTVSISYGHKTIGVYNENATPIKKQRRLKESKETYVTAY